MVETLKPDLLELLDIGVQVQGARYKVLQPQPVGFTARVVCREASDIARIGPSQRDSPSPLAALYLPALRGETRCFRGETKGTIAPVELNAY
jgi:hypothetical protein